MFEKVRQTAEKYNLLQKGDKVVVGVSGGPDSMALLYALRRLQKEYQLSLHIAHLNHRIRKVYAEKDADFVRGAAEKLGIFGTITSVDVPALARKRKLSLEQAAREARYEFYYNLAREVGADKIALGHTRDDQAETVLMRVIKGAGLLGLSGIPIERDFRGIKIIRPLLEISKKDIKKFLRAKGIAFRRDATNLSTAYFRNKVRLKLIPFLERNFDGFTRKNTAQIADNIRIDYNFLLSAAGRKFRKYAAVSDGKVSLDTGFIKEEPALQRLLIRLAIEKVKGDLSRVTYRHWLALEKLLRKKDKKWYLCLPGTLVIRKEKHALVFEKKQPISAGGIVMPHEFELHVPGRIKMDSLRKAISAQIVVRTPNFKTKKSRNIEYFDYNKLKLPLTVRFRREGDRMRPLGMRSAKRLKQLFIDEKTAVEERGRIPMVLSGEKIIWVCGLKRTDEARVNANSSRIVKLRYYGKKG